jgi:hypothetical protein
MTLPKTTPRRPMDRIHKGRKTGPKPLPPGDACDTRLTSMVRPVELALASLMAQRAGLTVSAWVRGLIVAAADPVLRPQAESIVRRWSAEDASDSSRRSVEQSLAQAGEL